MLNRISATTLSEQECVGIIRQLITGRGESGTGRFAKLIEAIGIRDAHFYNTDEAKPRLAPPFDKRQTFQSDAIRRAYVMAETRLLEHEPAFHVEAKKKTQEWKKVADALEHYLSQGLQQVERRNGYRLQGHLGHGQLAHCYGVLRCVSLRDSDLPAKETRDSLDGVEHSDYLPTEDGRYEETEQSRMRRYREQKADEPFPFQIDVPRSDTFAFIPDRSNPSGTSVSVFLEAVAFLDYERELRADDIYLQRGVDKRLQILTPAERPIQTDPSGGADWGDVTVAQVMLRDECYELASSGGGWVLVKSWKHSYGRPPVAMAPANLTNHPDPVYRYRPYLDGMFKTKPLYDVERNLGRLIAEETVIPRYWVELKEGGFWLDDSGQPLVLEQNSAIAQRMPEGAKLVRADVKIEPAFVQFLERSKVDLEESTPPLGYAEEIGASTQPHSIYAQITQSNAPMADLKRKQRTALEDIFQLCVNQMAVWAEEGDGIVIRTAGGELVEPTAEQLRGMTVGVKIEENSGAQQVAKEQYLREKSKDPAAVYTTADYLEETGREDKDYVFSSWLSEKSRMRVWPQIVEQELAKAYGDAYVLTPAGTAVGIDGQPLGPLEILAQAGFSALTTVATGPGSGSGQQSQPLSPTADPMQPLGQMQTPAAMEGENGMALA